jgi:hypothetical protein
MELNNLRPNQRYLFHYKNTDNEDEVSFRANFVRLFVHGKFSNIVVNCYESKKYPNESKKTWWSIDINLISKIETLPNIVGNVCLLPDDVLLEIDNYY